MSYAKNIIMKKIIVTHRRFKTYLRLYTKLATCTEVFMRTESSNIQRITVVATISIRKEVSGFSKSSIVPQSLTSAKAKILTHSKTS